MLTQVEKYQDLTRSYQQPKPLNFQASRLSSVKMIRRQKQQHNQQLINRINYLQLEQHRSSKRFKETKKQTDLLINIRQKNHEFVQQKQQALDQMQYDQQL